jgi:putative flippase GtrA
MLTTAAPERSSLRERLRGSWRILLKEVAAFGAVGAIGFVIQILLFNVLFHHGSGPLIANAIAVPVATVITYVGNRYLSFSHRARLNVGREAGYFFAINAVAFVFSEALFALFAYPFGFKYDTFVMNAVNLIGIGIGTVFRFWSYKRFVFLHPDRARPGSPDLDAELNEPDAV